MATNYTLPIRMQFASPNPDFSGSPADLINLLEELGSLVSSQSFSLFTSGSTEPNYDSGPWAKNGNEWYYFDVVTGQYIPFLVSQERLKYYVGPTQPDPTIYQFWIETDATTGQPLGLLTYVGTPTLAWVDVYYRKTQVYTKTELDALFEPTVAGKKQILYANIVGVPAAATKVAFAAHKAGAAQISTAGSGGDLITFDTVEHNYGNAFVANVFTAAIADVYHFDGGVNLQIASGTPTAIQTELRLVYNSSAIIALDLPPISNETGQRALKVSRDFFLNVGDTIELNIAVTSTGASTWNCLGGGLVTYFNGHRTFST